MYKTLWILGFQLPISTGEFAGLLPTINSSFVPRQPHGNFPSEADRMCFPIWLVVIVPKRNAASPPKLLPWMRSKWKILWQQNGSDKTRWAQKTNYKRSVNVLLSISRVKFHPRKTHGIFGHRGGLPKSFHLYGPTYDSFAFFRYPPCTLIMAGLSTYPLRYPKVPGYRNKVFSIRAYEGKPMVNKATRRGP